MKSLFPAFLTTSLLASPAAFSATVYTAHSDDLSIVSRFTDLVYDHTEGREIPREFCYIGEAQDVCAAIQKDSADALDEYMSGGHHAFEIESCTLESNRAKLRYRMFSDYTDDVTLEGFVSSCGDVEPKAKATLFQASFGKSGSELHVGTFRGVADGFSDRTRLCYEGEAQSVCDQIKVDLNRTLDEYKEGAHTYQQLNSCLYDQTKGVIKAEFTLYHDWENEPKVLAQTIGVCLR